MTGDTTDVGVPRAMSRFYGYTSTVTPWNMVHGQGVFNTPVRPPSW